MNFPIAKLKEIFKSNLPKDRILAIWGDFGVGKTTLAVQISIKSVNKHNKILYFYTKPNFPKNKLYNLAKINSDEKTSLSSSQFEIIEIKKFSELYSIVLKLEFLFLKQNKDEIKNYLIVFDSLTDLYKLELNPNEVEINVRLNYQLNQILATLNYLVENYNVEMLIVNEISRKTEMGELKEIQSGGSVMVYWIKNFIKIERTNVLNERKLIISLNNRREIKEKKVKLTDKGFR